jgi:hypothetical protein
MPDEKMHIKYHYGSEAMRDFINESRRIYCNIESIGVMTQEGEQMDFVYKEIFAPINKLTDY